jgi:glycosyltransferase involved in cell wall biosynthesis
VAVVPSVYEGFGLPAAEAMACGVPVISTTGGALPEVVGDAGILVPPGDTPALVNALTSVLDNPETAGILGAAGCRRVRRLFNWQRAAQMTADVYREAIRDHGRL